MKHTPLWILLSLASVLTATGCQPADTPDEPKAPAEVFVQGEIRIALPVRHTLDEAGKPIIKAWPDGGTTMIKITDAAGREWDVYFDRRLSPPTPTPAGEEAKAPANPETIYLHEYPGKPGSVQVIDPKGFRESVLRGINH